MSGADRSCGTDTEAADRDKARPSDGGGHSVRDMGPLPLRRSAVAVKAPELPAVFPADPADRLNAATAILESAHLMTKDTQIQESDVVRTVS